jgi:hypothetical protein
MEALRELDKEAKAQNPTDARYRRLARKRRLDARRNAVSGNEGQPLN